MESIHAQEEKKQEKVPQTNDTEISFEHLKDPLISGPTCLIPTDKNNK